MIKKVIKITKGLAIRITKDEVISLSSQLAYSFIFAFFPFLIFLITAVGYSSVSSQEVLVGLNRILPSNAVQLVKKTVIEVVDNPNVHLLSLSLIFTIWSSSGGFNAVIRGLNKAYGEDEYRSMIKIQLISILCTLGVSVIILSTILFLVFGQIIGNFIAFQIGFSSLFKVTWDIVRYIVIILSTIFIFAAIYHYTPCRKLTWREVIPGSIFSTIGLILVSIGFAFYVNNFTNYSMLYGSIGAVIVLLTWLFLVSAVIILGGELNAMLDL